jgi:hypothetical protein
VDAAHQALAALKQRCIVSGAIRRSDGVAVRVVAEQPPAPEARRSRPGGRPPLAHVARARGRGLSAWTCG